MINGPQYFNNSYILKLAPIPQLTSFVPFVEIHAAFVHRYRSASRILIYSSRPTIFARITSVFSFHHRCCFYNSVNRTRDIIARIIAIRASRLCFTVSVTISSLIFSISFLPSSSPLFLSLRTRSHTRALAYLGREIFQDGRAVYGRSGTHSTMTRGSVFQMPVNSAHGKLQRMNRN